MSFGALGTETLLALYGALAFGMVLLYVLRLRRRRVEVPFAPLWARVVEERQSTALFRRLKRLFSLLVQLALLALLVLALGDPKLDGGGFLSGCGFAPPDPPPPRHTLLLLDSSASMASFERGRSRIERAAEEAHRVVDSLGPNPAHRVMVAAADTRVRPLTLWTTDRKEVHEAIEGYLRAGPRDTPTDMAAALDVARQVLRGREGAETVLVTDRGFAPLEAPDVRVLGAGEGGVNVGLEAFNVRPYLDDSLTYALFYAVRNTADRPVRATLFVYANESGRAPEDFVQPERIVAAYPLELPAKGVLRKVVGDLRFAGSRLAARVVLDASEPAADVFPRDDLAFALVPERKRLRVQLVTEGNLFLQASLLVRENVDFEVVAPAAYASPDGFDLTIVDGAAVDLSRPGRYLLVDPAPGGPFEVRGTVESPEVARVDAKHALSRGLAWVDPAIARASAITTERGDEVVVAAADGTPLVLTRRDETGGRTFAVLAFDLRESLLPLNYAFPLLVVNALNWFQPQPDGLVPTHRAGVELSLPADLPPGPLTVTGPGRAEARLVDGRVHLTADRIGIYEIASPGAEEPLRVALNLLDPAESDVAPRGDYAAWTPPPPWTPPAPPWPGTPWRALLVVALGIVALEWLTFHRRLTV